MDPSAGPSPSDLHDSLRMWHKALAIELATGLAALHKREAEKKKKRKFQGLGIGTTQVAHFLEEGLRT